MLKNKKAIFILIPVNLLVWGFFAYRIFSAFTETETNVISMKAPSLKVTIAPDSIAYKLRMDYKDPFLKDVKQERDVQVSRSADMGTPRPKNTAPKIVAPVMPKQLPDVKYLGLIKNNESGLTTALVSVNGESRLIKPNESINGIVFKTFNKDSLVAKWGKERIVARK